jgi:hypothetical protein
MRYNPHIGLENPLERAIALLVMVLLVCAQSKSLGRRESGACDIILLLGVIGGYWSILSLMRCGARYEIMSIALVTASGMASVPFV